MAQLANEAVVELQQEKNEHEWYQDKGRGVPKPEEEEESEEEDDVARRKEMPSPGLRRRT